MESTDNRLVKTIHWNLHSQGSRLPSTTTATNTQLGPYFLLSRPWPSPILRGWLFGFVCLQIVPVFRRGCSSVRFWSDSWGTGGMMCASPLAALPSVPSIYGRLKFCLMPHNFQSCSNRKYWNILTALHTSLVRGGSPSLCILVLRLSEKSTVTMHVSNASPPQV